MGDGSLSSSSTKLCFFFLLLRHNKTLPSKVKTESVITVRSDSPNDAAVFAFVVVVVVIGPSLGCRWFDQSLFVGVDRSPVFVFRSAFAGRRCIAAGDGVVATAASNNEAGDETNLGFFGENFGSILASCCLGRFRFVFELMMGFGV
ncbi:hypothetical protein Dsin_023877 [Dipteronia sinensis]|uniref:Uncharacterized protein n=1 Tax=Dipteronia sinensis TaxID=43782 RepID=A0AAE0A4Z9_9ROSI|nr:hypothetical protein Dsin_023877 [Dipteronia sinensis]